MEITIILIVLLITGLFLNGLADNEFTEGFGALIALIAIVELFMRLLSLL